MYRDERPHLEEGACLSSRQTGFAFISYISLAGVSGVKQTAGNTHLVLGKVSRYESDALTHGTPLYS